MEHPIGSLMNITMEKIKEMIDVNTIVGTPITSALSHGISGQCAPDSRRRQQISA